MRWIELDRHRAGSRSGRVIDAFSLLFSYYAVPVAVGILSLYALLYPSEAPEFNDGAPLSIRSIVDSGNHLKPGTALAALGSQPWQRRYNTHLSEKPVWFTVSAPPANPSPEPAAAAPSRPDALLFPSRHIQNISCFDVLTLAPIGSASVDQPSTGQLSRSGSGIAVMDARDGVVCRAVFSGPAVLSASHLATGELKDRNDIYHRRSGLLEGGLATLAIFVLLTALINRDWVYVLFAAWLVGNLRLGAISMGWDDHWLGFPLPTHWVSLIRKITVPVYYILTFTLFQTLFKNDLVRVGCQRLLRTFQWLGPILLVASIALPVRFYLPLMWGIASYSIAAIVFILIRLLVVTPSRMAFWYCAALVTALVASFSEVASAAFGTRILIPALNSVTAALVSSLMAALAIAEQIRAERAERMRAQAELRHAYDVTPVGLFTLGADGSFIRFNPALESMFGMGKDKRRRHWDDYLESGSWQPIYRQAMENGAVELELSHVDVQKPSGRPVSESTEGEDGPVGSPTGSGAGDRRHYLVKAAFAGKQLEGSVQDITERQQAIQTLSFLADHDPLTGALNRRGIDRYISDGPAQGVQTELPQVFAYLDLDRFKLINDLFGHHTGDEVLKQVCMRIEAELRPTDCVGRVGGDEFVIVFHDMPIHQAASVAQAIIDSIDSETYQIGHRAFHVRASLGLIERPAGLRAADAISAADGACREAKANGNGRVVVYLKDAPMFVERASDLSLIERFSGDLPLNGLFLEMQPIMSLKTPYGSLDFEVLLRMRGPAGTVIPPVKVISAAEANGTISALDKWVMETTLRWIERNRARLQYTRFVCVNVSGASLNDERFVADIGELLVRYRHVVPLLCLEITEGVALHDLDNTRRLVSGVQRLGAKVAFDDFGAGYTSFAYLRDLPADALKIDGAFVRQINHFPANAAIVEAIVGLARNLGMQSIAEWVEDAATLRSLQAMRVDYVQGYAIARPQSPDAILLATSAADFIKDPDVLALIGPSKFLLSMDDETPRPLH